VSRSIAPPGRFCDPAHNLLFAHGICEPASLLHYLFLADSNKFVFGIPQIERLDRQANGADFSPRTLRQLPLFAPKDRQKRSAVKRRWGPCARLPQLSPGHHVLNLFSHLQTRTQKLPLHYDGFVDPSRQAAVFLLIVSFFSLFYPFMPP